LLVIDVQDKTKLKKGEEKHRMRERVE